MPTHGTGMLDPLLMIEDLVIRIEKIEEQLERTTTIVDSLKAKQDAADREFEARAAQRYR
tara:strand:- start:694 stop:873 length:180 start_codon:yes stop_codon:yes gene_type:complete